MIGFLKKEGGQRAEELASLHRELGKADEEATVERELLTRQHEEATAGLEGQLQDRLEEVGGAGRWAGLEPCAGLLGREVARRVRIPSPAGINDAG